ncbi:MAG TPA: hypothetical protein VGP57_16175 [Actinoplanes sp.]|nr:hypothetical protein [Actinoplanes sp.]
MNRPRADAVAGLAAAGLFAVAAVVGAVAGLAGHPVHAGAAPLFAHWLPHVGPGTPLALAVAAVVVWRGPAVAARLGWRALLGAGYAASVAWSLALALVDGWQRGLADRLTTRYEYLSEVGGVTDVPAMLRGFSARILDGGPDSWTTHVAGHPPGALLVFVGLDRIGRGGGWAAVACVLAGSLVAVAVPVTLRALATEEAARVAMPFLVLFPGAIWVGASADGLFAGVAATGLSLLAIGLTRPSRPAALAAGVLLSFAAYLSYGLVLLAPLAFVIVLAAGHTRPPKASDARALALWALAGGAAVVFAFSASGFSWLDGYHLVQQRYFQGLASHRPYAYWVWANLAALAASAGPAAAPILRRAVTAALSTMVTNARRLVASSKVVSFARHYAEVAPAPADRARAPQPNRPAGSAASRAIFPAGGGSRMPAAVIWLPLAALAAVLLADLSGLSKAEVERIWLPFAVWLPAGAALLPAGDRRGWLAVQATTALLINHLLLTVW